MISDKIVISDKENECEGLDAALALIQKTAAYEGFDADGAVTLAHLADEMVAGSASILDVFTGTMWAETDETWFKVQLEMQGEFTQVAREEFISLTRDNRNTLPKGFFGKLGVLLADVVSGEYAYPYGEAADPASAEMLWDSAELAQLMAGIEFKPDAEDRATEAEAKQALDALADDIQVAARADRVLVTVFKRLPGKA